MENKKPMAIKAMFASKFNEFLLDDVVMVKGKNNDSVVSAHLIQDPNFIDDSDRSRVVYMFNRDEIDMEFHEKLTSDLKEYECEGSWIGIKNKNVDFRFQTLSNGKTICLEVVGNVQANFLEHNIINVYINDTESEE